VDEKQISQSKTKKFHHAEIIAMVALWVYAEKRLF